jgi:membrane protein required for colicin V production
MNPVTTAAQQLPNLIQGVSTIDLVAFILIFLLGLRCAFRGFVRETMDMAGILVGLLFGVLFSGLLAPVLETWLGKTPWNQILAFGAIWILTWFLMYLLRDTLQAVVDNLELNNLDHALGFLLGALEGALLVFLLLFLLNLQQVVPMRPTLDQSLAFQLLSPFFAYADHLLTTTVGAAS